MKYLLIVTLLLSGCEERKCLKSHDDLVFISQQFGDVTILQPNFITVCDSFLADTVYAQ